MASFLAGVAASAGSHVLKQGLKTVAKNQNILIPLDDFKNTQIIDDANLKKQVCGSAEKAPVKKKETKRKKKSRLERILERLD